MNHKIIFLFLALFFLTCVLGYSQIVIDGNFNDWNSISSLGADYQGDATIDTCDIYNLYVFDNMDSIFVRVTFSNNSNLNTFGNGGFYGEFHIFISVDPGDNNSDNTGLDYGWWTNGYDFLCSKGYWTYNFKMYKHNDPNGTWQWEDSNWFCTVAYNNNYNDFELKFPKSWLRYPNNIPNFPDTGVGKLAIMLAAVSSSDYSYVDTLYRTSTSFGGLIYELNYPLPVELVSFTAAYKGKNSVELKWSTATEVNNYGFEIERAYKSKMKNILDWEKIGFVPGNGTSMSPKNYSFVDANVYYGTYVYRLKQIDIDGNFKYSDYVEINTGRQPEPAILEQNFPNPFNPKTSIKFILNEDKHTTLKIYNTLGEKVATLFDDLAEANKVYNIKFNADNLPSGIYIYKLQAGEYTKTKKMILIK